MQTPIDIYAKYEVMPTLQLHQLRVAGVAKMVCDNREDEVDTRAVLLAALFHDMGNIIKSDLTYFPEFTEPEGVAHWQMVKDRYVKKYGKDHHGANTAIARELGLPSEVIHIIEEIGFSNLNKILSGGSVEQQIVEYADLRVGPHGVLSVESRLEEGRQRYVETRTKRVYYESDTEFERLADSARKLEKKIFSATNIEPDDISEQAITPILEELRKYAVFS